MPKPGLAGPLVSRGPPDKTDWLAGPAAVSVWFDYHWLFGITLCDEFLL
jgi:hypothetical protein